MSAVVSTPADQRLADGARVHRTLMGYLGTKALLSALELGLFDAIEQGPATAEEIAQRIGLPERSTRQLLLGVEGEGFVRSEQGRYHNDSAASTFLVSSSPDYIGQLAMHQDAHFVKFAKLTQVLRENRPAELSDDYYIAKPFGRSGPGGGNWAEGLANVTVSTYRLMGDHATATPLEGHRHMVELGCGSCVYSIGYAKANPHLRVTAIDNPAIAAVGRGYVERAGLSDRFDVRPGNMFADKFPECDVALLANALQGYDRERARALIMHIGSYLPKGGELLIQTHLPLAPPFTSQIGLILMVNNKEGGEAHDEATTRGWLAEAGFTEVRVEPTSSIHTLVRARK